MQYIYLLTLTNDKVLRLTIGDAYCRQVSHMLSAVVVAPSEEDARGLCDYRARESNDPDTPDDPDYGAHWRFPKIASCIKLGVAEEGREEGIILFDAVDGS